MGISWKEMRGNGAEEIPKGIMAKNFSNLMRHQTDPQSTENTVQGIDQKTNKETNQTPKTKQNHT